MKSILLFFTFVFIYLLQVEFVTLLDDNSLHMWTLRAHNGMSELLEIGRFTLSGPPGWVRNTHLQTHLSLILSCLKMFFKPAVMLMHTHPANETWALTHTDPDVTDTHWCSESIHGCTHAVSWLPWFNVAFSAAYDVIFYLPMNGYPY